MDILEKKGLDIEVETAHNSKQRMDNP